MEAKIMEEIMEKHLKADASISLFFIGVDAIFYILILLILGCDFKSFSSPKQMLSQIILSDVLLRIYILYFNKFDYQLINEIIFSLFATFQFLLLNKILKKIFYIENSNNNTNNKDSIELKNPYLFAGLFLFLTFTFKLSKTVSVLQYCLSILVIFLYSYLIQAKINVFLNELESRKFDISCKKIQYNLTYLIGFYFVLFYLLKILSLFVEDKLYYSYTLMVCDIFKEGGKFLAFGLMMLLVNSYNKYIKDEDVDSSMDKGYIN